METTSVSVTLGPQVLGALGNSAVNQLATRYSCISNALRQTHSLPHTQTRGEPLSFMGPNVVVVGRGIDIRQVWFLPVQSLESSWKTGLGLRK